MAGLRSPQEFTAEQIITPLDEALTRYEESSSFSCGGSLEKKYGAYMSAGTHYGDFTSKRKPVKYAPITIRWDGKGGTSKKITFDPASTYRDREPTLEDLVQDCEPATFGFNGKDVFDEAVRKAGKLEAYMFSTNFNPYDYGIVDLVAQQLQPDIVRAGKQPSVDRWGVVAELYKLNVYSGPSGMFKPHIDTPRGRTQFGSLVVCLPTEFKGGQLRVAHKGRERVFEFGSRKYSEIKWAAFYSDCEHEVLPVTSGYRVTITYQLYVSEHLGGLVQPTFRTPDSKMYQLYRSIKDMLSSHISMKSGGILGFHCAYQYPQKFEGTHYYERYPLMLKGTDAVLFTLFRAFDLTVHIKAYEEYYYGSIDDATKRRRSLISTQDDTGTESETVSVSVKTVPIAEQQIPDFERDGYVSDEIFQSTTWFNEWTAQKDGKEYHEVARPVIKWIGNEIEVQWNYATLALLVVVPELSKRELKDKI